MGLFARDTNQLLAMKGNMPCPSQAVPEPGQEPKVFIDPPFLIHSGEETLAISYKIVGRVPTLPISANQIAPMPAFWILRK